MNIAPLIMVEAAAGGGGSALIRFSTLTDMTETGNGTTGWIYTGDASTGTAGGPDYSVASGVAGGMEVEVDTSGSYWPTASFATTTSGAGLDDYHILAYAFDDGGGPDWYAVSTGFTDIVTNARTYETGDHLRLRFDSGNGAFIEIARAATPTTWLALGSTTLTRSVTLYPRLASLNDAGAVLTAPRTVV